MLQAITRAVSGSLEHCELTHLDRQPLDLALARVQHAAYVEALERLGCRVLELPEAPDFPDAVFVEDTALVLDEVAVPLRPGAASRRGEVPAVAAALSPFRELRTLTGGCVDGGDLLVLGKTVVAGNSGRTDRQGIAALAEALAPFGYRVAEAVVTGCLHLKSAVTRVTDDTLLIHREWVAPDAFAGWRLLEIDPDEPFAANALALETGLLYPESFPRTAERLERLGLRLELVDLTELAKAEGAVTCCSLVFEASPPHPRPLSH